MALARLDIPGLVLYNGSIAPGRFRGHDVTIQDVFEAVGAHAAGTMSGAELHELEGVACPGAGACGGQFTANTMATALEFLGISPRRALNGIPALDPAKTSRGRGGRPARDAARPRRRQALADHHARGARERSGVGRRHRRVDERRPPPARHRARAGDPASSSRTSTGSRRARRSSRPEAGRPLRRDRPARGRRRRARRARAPEAADSSTPTRRTSTGARSARSRRGRRDARPGGRASRSRRRSSRPAGSRSCAGTSRPEGCVVKLAGHERLLHRGPARVFDSEEDCFAAVKARTIQPGDVVVIRYEGPARRPGHARDAARHGRARGRGARRRRSRSSRTAASRARRTG